MEIHNSHNCLLLVLMCLMVMVLLLLDKLMGMVKGKERELIQMNILKGMCSDQASADSASL